MHTSSNHQKVHVHKKPQHMYTSSNHQKRVKIESHRLTHFEVYTYLSLVNQRSSLISGPCVLENPPHTDGTWQKTPTFWLGKPYNLHRTKHHQHFTGPIAGGTGEGVKVYMDVIEPLDTSSNHPLTIHGTAPTCRGRRWRRCWSPSG